MILQTKEDNIEIETSGINSIIGGIDEKNIPYIMEMVSSSFYSNKIGSIIRELTSNCFDSHRRAGVENPVVINIDYDDENETYYIEFKDVGTGLSPTAMNNIYMRWFTSDKRDSNNEIGGFGIGSKSAFSYTDLFYINTVVDNVKYEYIHYKSERNEKGVRDFKLDLIIDYPTTQRNGTTIRIDIKEEDLNKFLIEIIEQLSYFDNVLVTRGKDVPDIKEYNVNKLSTFNNEKIYEYKTFKYRQKSHEETELFILIDTVKYPIDFKELKINTVQIPFGLKFQIGELSVTPNRENIEYTTKNKEVILNKYKEFIEEITDLIRAQNTFIFDNYIKYTSTITNIYLTLGDISTNNYTKLLLDNKVVEKSFGIKVNKIYTPLKDFKYTISNSILSLFYSVVGEIDDTGNIIEKYYSITTLHERKEKIYIINSKNELSKIKNYFLNGYIVIRRKPSKSEIRSFFDNYFNYCYVRNNIVNYDYINNREGNYIHDNFISPRRYDYVETTIKHKGKIYSKKTRKANLIDKAVSAYTLFKHFNSLLNKEEYSDIILTEEMNLEYKEYLKSKNKNITRRANKKVLCYTGAGTRREYDLSYLASRKYLLCSIRGEKSYFKTNKGNTIEVTANNIYSFLMEKNKRVLKETKDLYPLEVIQISKTNFSQIKNLNNIISYGDFFNIPSVKKQLIRKSLEREIWGWGSLFNNNTAFNRLCELSQYYRDIKKKVYNQPSLFNELDSQFSNFNFVDYNKYKELSEIYSLFQEILKIDRDFNLINQLQYNVPKSVILELLRYEAKKIGKLQYLKFLDHYYVYPSQYLVGFIENGNHYKNLKLEQEQNNLLYLS